jgi:hypothetical protein
VFRALWLFRHAPVICHSQTAAVSALVLSAVPHDAVITRFGSEHGDQLLDHHYLAGLRRRKHDELFQPDGGTLRAELFGGRCGASGGGTGTNLSFPVAFTYSNRTELVVHPAWGLQVGISYNLTSLFSSSGTTKSGNPPGTL